MKNHQLLIGLFSFLGILILIVHSEVAFYAASEALSLCLGSVIPSLFPFFILSTLLTRSLSGVDFKILHPLANLLKIPPGAQSILITGFLGGYPVGAKSIADAHQYSGLSKPDAERMLAFCNNAGPAFIFGVVSAFFPEKRMVWMLWAIHVFSAILTGICFRVPIREHVTIRKNTISISAALEHSLFVMATVCGWIIVFKVISNFLSLLLLNNLPCAAQTIAVGLLELTNGCFKLPAIDNIQIRFLICSGLLACGGLCVTMQTVSVAKNLSLQSYYKGKLLQTIFSILLSLLLIYKHWYVLITIPGLIFLLVQQNNSGIKASVSV